MFGLAQRSPFSRRSNFVGELRENLFPSGSLLDPSSWVVAANCMIAGGLLSCVSALGIRNNTHPISVEAGKTYEVKFETSGFMSGTVRVLLYSSSNSGVTPVVSDNGENSFDVTLDGSGTAFLGRLVVQFSNGATGSISNLQVFEK